MIESILTRKNVGIRGRVTVKAVLSAGIIALAVLLASVCGRLAFLALAAVFQGVSGLTVATVWSQIQTGLLGLVAQAVLVPVIVMAVAALANREKEE